MRASFALPDWNTLAAYGDDELPLLETALLIARDEYPAPRRRPLRGARSRAYADALQPEAESTAIDLPATLTAINRYLFEEARLRRQQHAVRRPAQQLPERGLRPQAGHPDFAGGGADRSDAPAGRAAGRHLVPRPFPGAPAGRRRHPGDGPVQQGPPGERRRTERTRVAAPGWPAAGRQQLIEILVPATHRMILMRMLRNLNGLYLEREDWERVARTADRLLRISPEASKPCATRPGLRELGHAKGAREDLARYLQLSTQCRR